MREILIEERLKKFFEKIYRKDRKLYKICMSKIEEIASSQEHYKSLRYDLKGMQRVHLMKSFVLVFSIEGNTVKFIDMDHHDRIYRKKF